MTQTSRIFARLTGSALALGLLLMTVTALAGPPTDFVKAKSGKLFEIVNQDLSPARTKAMKKEVRTLINYEELATRALGKHWDARSPEEKKEFIGLLEELVELNYANRFQSKKAGQDYKVNYTDEKVRAKTGQAIVKTNINYDKESFTIDYKMVGKDGADYSIYDVVFDEISLEETYREAYVPIIEKSGWKDLISRMKTKLKELKG